MNKLILVGNGFDLAHGLETSYSDFILWFLNESLKEYNLKYYEKYENNLLTIEKGKYGAGIRKFESIKHFQEANSKENIKVKFKNNFLTKLISDSFQYNWVDVESKYYSELVDLYKRLEKQDIERHPKISEELSNLNNCFNLLKIKLSEYLTLIETSPKKINEEINSHFVNEQTDNEATGIKKRRTKNNIVVLNFNYTSTVELYKNNFQENNFTINYIHGKLNDSNNPIIFGYGDEMHKYYEKIEQLDSDDFLMNIKSFEYFKTKNYQDFISFIESEQFEVAIMGHSCGLSDRILLNSIFENENCKRIKIYYHEKSALDNDYFEKTQKISRHFKTSTKDKMRKKIIPFNDKECIPLRKFKS